MKKPRFASRPRVENLESRLQPGSVITGAGYGWSLLADSLSILNQDSSASTAPISQPSSENSNPTQTSAPADVHSDNLNVGVISAAASGNATSSLPTSTLVENPAANLTNDVFPNLSLPGHLNSVPLAAVAASTAREAGQALPNGSVPQSPIGVTTPGTPVTPSAPMHTASSGLRAVPAQDIKLDTPTVRALTDLHTGNDLQAVPVHLNPPSHFGGGGNQATINFLSYLGSSGGPDSVNSVVVQTEGGANFIYVAGSFTDNAGRTDAFAAKLADGATSLVWMSAITSATLPALLGPGPDVAAGLAVNGNNVYLAITATDPTSTPQTRGFVVRLNAGSGATVGSQISVAHGSFAAVATDSSGKVYVAGSVDDPSNSDRIDTAFIKVNADLSSAGSNGYDVRVAFPLLGNDVSTAITTGSGLALDSSGNAYFGGTVGVIGDPSIDTKPFHGRLNAAGNNVDWALAHSNVNPGQGATGTAVALDPNGNVVVTSSLYNTGGSTPLSQDLYLGRYQPDGTRVQSVRWYVDDRAGHRSGDWAGISLVVLPDGSSIVTGLTFDPAAGTNGGDPTSIPSKGVDVHLTHFDSTDRATIQNTDGDPENIFGGTLTEVGNGVALDPTNPTNVYVVGSTSSTDLPTTAGVLFPSYAGTNTTGFVGQANVM